MAPNGSPRLRNGPIPGQTRQRAHGGAACRCAERRRARPRPFRVAPSPPVEPICRNDRPWPHKAPVCFRTAATEPPMARCWFRTPKRHHNTKQVHCNLATGSVPTERSIIMSAQLSPHHTPPPPHPRHPSLSLPRPFVHPHSYRTLNAGTIRQFHSSWLERCATTQTNKACELPCAEGRRQKCIIAALVVSNGRKCFRCPKCWSHWWVLVVAVRNDHRPIRRNVGMSTGWRRRCHHHRHWQGCEEKCET